MTPVVRYVFARLRDDVRRDDVAPRLRAVLAEVGADATVGIPADDSAARWDLGIAIRCPSLGAWEALAAKPSLVRAFADLDADAVVVKAWTFTG